MNGLQFHFFHILHSPGLGCDYDRIMSGNSGILGSEFFLIEWQAFDIFCNYFYEGL